MAGGSRLTEHGLMKRTILFAALFVFAAAQAGASIAVFTDGRAMKVASFKPVDEETMQLTLKGGGSLTVPLARVDRIVDDEVVEAAIVAEGKKIVEEQGGVFPKRSWRYSEESTPLFRSRFDQIIVEAAKK